jgi:hypothetical protein
MNLSLIENSPIIFIKILAIAYITIIYSLGGVLITTLANKYLIYDFYDRTDEELEKKSTPRHLFETVTTLVLFSVLAYISRNILQRIPFPLDGIYDFKYKNVKEVAAGALLIWVLINYSPILANKTKIITRRIGNLI